MIPVRFNDASIADIGAIWDRLAPLSAESATRIATMLIEAALGLDEMPRRHPVVERWKSREIRRLNLEEWAILYRVTTLEVEIVRILFGGMNFEVVEFPNS